MIGDHVFMHAKHVTEHKVDCIQCHTPILHALDPKKLEDAAGDCQSCHPNHHQEQVDLLEGTGARLLGGNGGQAGLGIQLDGRRPHRVPHLPQGPGNFLDGHRTRARLHGHVRDVPRRGHREAIRGLSRQLAADLPALQATLAKVEAAAKQPGDRPAKLLAEIGEMRHDLDLLIRGNDIHNMHYATKVVREVTQRLAAVCRQLKVEEPKVLLPAPVQEKPTSTRVDAAKPAAEKKDAK